MFNRSLLHLLHIQLNGTSPVACPRPKVGTIRPSLPPPHLPHPNHGLLRRLHPQLGHDVDVSFFSLPLQSKKPLTQASIVKNQRDILLGIAGSNIWSGQNVQQFNTLAVAWSMASDIFSVGGKYQWVTIAFLFGFVAPLPLWIANRFYPHPFFRYINTSIILWQMGYLFVGINSAITVFFALGFFAQWYLRKKRPELFVKYNYITSAALDGGTQVMVFILTFAVFGGSGKARPFPTWAGNPDTTVHNLDYCKLNTATGA